MGSTSNYPYQNVCNILGSIGFETWIFGTVPSQLFPYASHTYQFTNKSFPDVCYIPDSRASQTFAQYQNTPFGTNQITYKLSESSDNNPAGYENIHDQIITFYQNDSQIAQYSLELTALIQGKCKNITIDKYNFYVMVAPDQSITNIGLTLQVDYSNENEDAFYSVVLSTPISDATVITALTEIMNVRELPGYYGSYEEVLENSNNFEITVIPTEWENKYIYSAEHNKFNETVCTMGEPSGIYDRSVAFKSSTSTTDVWKPDNSNYILMRNLAIYINGDGGGHLGSDILRRTSNNGFTNGADLDQSENILKSGNPLESLIEFSGGYIKLWVDGTAYDNGYKKITVYDANMNAIDTYQLPYPTSGGASTLDVGATNIYYNSLCSCYLVHYDTKFHLYGLRQFFALYDDDGNIINYQRPLYPSNPYQAGCFFQKLYTFNNQANQILESATKYIFDDNPEYQYEDSEQASLPDDMDDVYDRDSTWNTGDKAGENDGIRYSGDSNINPTDLESTRSDDIPGGHQPSEDPDTPGHIPTPVNTGMINILAPTESQMALFASDLRSDTFLQSIINYFSNPMDIVISAHTCIAPALVNGSDKYLQYGLWTSSYTMKALKQQYYKVSMGTFNLLEYSKSFADYPPISNYYIYLPYIGLRQIDGAVLVGRQLTLYYYIDVATGDILAELLYRDMKTGKECPVGYYNGNTLARFPLKSVDYSSIINNAISGVFGTASAIGQVASGNIAGGVLNGISTGIQSMKNGTHPDISINGTVSGSLTYTMYDTPYIIQTAPHFYNKLPYGYKHYKGMPSITGTVLGDSLKMASKFIQFDTIDLDGIVNEDGDGATQEEKNEILKQLQQGVFTK